MSAYEAQTTSGEKVTIVEKYSERADLGMAGMVYVADDGTEYVTVSGHEAHVLMPKAEAEAAVEFEPTAEQTSEESTGGEDASTEESQTPPAA